MLVSFINIDNNTPVDNLDYRSSKIEIWKDELISDYLNQFASNLPYEIINNPTLFEIERYLYNNFSLCKDGNMILFNQPVTDERILKRLRKVCNLPYINPKTYIQREYNKFVRWMNSSSSEKRYLVTLKNEKVFSYDESKKRLDTKLNSFIRRHINKPVAYFSEVGKKEQLYHYHIIMNSLTDVQEITKFALKHELSVYSERCDDTYYSYDRLFRYARKSKQFYSYRTPVVS